MISTLTWVHGGGGAGAAQEKDQTELTLVNVQVEMWSRARETSGDLEEMLRVRRQRLL